MNTTTATNILSGTVENALASTVNTNTAIIIAVGIGVAALLISKAMDKGYNTELNVAEGKLIFGKVTIT